MRLFSFNNGLDAVMVAGAVSAHLIRDAAVADGLEAVINKAIVDQLFCMFLRLEAVEGIAHILGGFHIYIPIVDSHFLVGGIVGVHIEVTGNYSGIVAQLQVIFVHKLCTLCLTGISKPKVGIHKQEDLAGSLFLQLCPGADPVALPFTPAFGLHFRRIGDCLERR